MTYLLLPIPLVCFDLCWNLNVFYAFHQLLRIEKWNGCQVNAAFLRVRHDAIAPFQVFGIVAVVFLVFASLESHAHHESKIQELGVRLDMAGSIGLVEHG